ncbi:Autophagy-related protein [Erysiphe necator]|uniref:Autophagy-related protein 17 n=1 Tax=Uncinula necator TaxID=52586 RepID=A0A0B1PHS9_UNCNE|nr:Autophagy-related protein [Erysiphe necator]KHJ36346.1 putative kinase activator [Erysiphe necator]
MSTSSRTSQRHIASTPSNSRQARSATRGDISLDKLVSHLLAAKLSLASIKTVSRANEIVISARAALEECAVVTARTNFLRKGIKNQAATLRQLRAGIVAVYDQGQKDFMNVIRTLDAANQRLENTMNTLRSTIVEAAFRPEVEEPRCLLDFVHEQGVETMRDSLKENIREAKATQAEFDSAIVSLDNDLSALKASMVTKSDALPFSEFESQIPDSLQCLESHAQQMADLLESLVQHFDLCVTAIRNTEGGTAAVRKAASSPPPGVDAVSVSGVISSGSIPANEEQISDEEMQEIHDVLEKDARQVEGVVMELQDLLTDMEVKYQVILDFVSLLNASYQEQTATFKMLEIVGSRLQGYVLASHDFNLRWDETKASILSQLSELESIRIFYENYYSSYDALILEVQRRKQCQDQVQSVLKKAMDQLDRLYEFDSREREEFSADVGEFLPVDLWPGIGDVTPRWGFVRVDGGVTDSIPHLSNEIIERASMRARKRETINKTRLS